MTLAEVNEAIAKAKGWEPSTWGVEHGKWASSDHNESTLWHHDPTDDPREWSRLLEELLSGDCPTRFVSHSLGMWSVSGVWGSTLGEAVCRAWFAWKGAADV